MKYFQEDEKQIFDDNHRTKHKKQSMCNILMQMNRRGKQANKQN